MYSDEEETVYERHYIDEEKTRKNFVKRSAVIKSEMLKATPHNCQTIKNMI